MADIYRLYKEKERTLPELLELLEKASCIVGGAYANEPVDLYMRLHELAGRGQKQHVWLCNTQHAYPFITEEEYRDAFVLHCAFFGQYERQAAARGQLLYHPWHLADWTKILAEYMTPDAYAAAVAPMDEDGWFYFSPVDQWESELCRMASIRILIENPAIPVVNGSERIHISEITAHMKSTTPICTNEIPDYGDVEAKIGQYIAELVSDGDTLQLGIGKMPAAVAAALSDKKDLGIYTELFSPSITELIKKDVVTNERKNLYRGQSVFAFAWGNEEMYRYIDRNDKVLLQPVRLVNDPFRIAQNERLISINTCLQMDFTGQVSSESFGLRQFSGMGGATHFAMGAYLSKGGKGILAMTSTAKGGTVSRIRPVLDPGSAVTIQRNYVDYVVTEYGVAHLRYLDTLSRARALIGIAHPDFRKELSEQMEALML